MDVYDYIIKHPAREKVFPEYTNDEILVSVYESILSGCLLYILDNEGKIIGLALGRQHNVRNEMHVKALFADNLKIVKQLVARFKQIWPNFVLVANRRYGLKDFTKWVDKQVTINN